MVPGLCLVFADFSDICAGIGDLLGRLKPKEFIATQQAYPELDEC
jgi:hypothetical protein